MEDRARKQNDRVTQKTKRVGTYDDCECEGVARNVSFVRAGKERWGRSKRRHYLRGDHLHLTPRRRARLSSQVSHDGFQLGVVSLRPRDHTCVVCALLRGGLFVARVAHVREFCLWKRQRGTSQSRTQTRDRFANTYELPTLETPELIDRDVAGVLQDVLAQEARPPTPGYIFLIFSEEGVNVAGEKRPLLRAGGMDLHALDPR